MYTYIHECKIQFHLNNIFSKKKNHIKLERINGKNVCKHIKFASIDKTPTPFLTQTRIKLLLTKYLELHNSDEVIDL